MLDTAKKACQELCCRCIVKSISARRKCLYHWHQVVDILAKNPAKIIIKIESNEENLIQAFKDSQIGQKVYFSKQGHKGKKVKSPYWCSDWPVAIGGTWSIWQVKVVDWV